VVNQQKGLEMPYLYVDTAEHLQVGDVFSFYAGGPPKRVVETSPASDDRVALIIDHDGLQMEEYRSPITLLNNCEVFVVDTPTTEPSDDVSDAADEDDSPKVIEMQLDGKTISVVYEGRVLVDTSELMPQLIDLYDELTGNEVALQSDLGTRALERMIARLLWLVHNSLATANIEGDDA
jgi:hypothetical protein